MNMRAPHIHARYYLVLILCRDRRKMLPEEGCQTTSGSVILFRKWGITMPFDAITVAALRQEFQQTLINGRIDKIFQPGKGKVVMSIFHPFPRQRSEERRVGKE